MVLNRSKYGETYLLPFKYSYSQYKTRKEYTRFNVLTKVGVKQLTDFLRTVTAASDLVDCTLVNCDYDFDGTTDEHRDMTHYVNVSVLIKFSQKKTSVFTLIIISSP